MALCKTGALQKDLTVHVTLLQRNVAGRGVLLALFDDNLRKKALSKTNPNGSILYVDAEEDCFFISIFFVMMYNRFSWLFGEANSRRERRRLFEGLHDCLQLSGPPLLR